MVNTNKLLGKIKENGISVSDLAKRLGVSRPTITAKIQNKRSFTIDEMVAIRNELELSADDCKTIFFVPN